MKPSAVVQDEDNNTTLSTAYGRFFRAYLQQTYPHELEAQLEAWETSAQHQLQAALEQENKSQPTATSLYRLAVKITLTTLRQAKQEQSDRSMVWVDLSEPPLSDEITTQQQHLQKALAQLPEARRRAVELYFSGLTTPEISDLLAWGETKAQQQLERGLRDLRKVLRKVGLEYEID